MTLFSLLFLGAIACRSAPSEPAPEPTPVEEPEAPGEVGVIPTATHEGRLRGICDGSAAVRLADGALVVAYDEDTSLYSFDGMGNPLGSASLAALLHLPEQPEFDLEGAASIGGPSPRVWWVGSHGRNKDGEDAPARRMLFATNLPKPDLSDLALTEKPVDLLPILRKDSLLAAALTPAVLAQAPKEGGVSIEALAGHPNGGLLVGFRSPVVERGGKTLALVAHVQRNETGWVATGKAVDLGGRGLRDFAPHNSGWIAIAGSPTKAEDFALFHIDPTYSALQVGEPAWTEGIRPEAIVRHESGWLLISDDGKVDRPDEGAKDGQRACDDIRKKRGADHREVYFRVRTIPMPEGM